MKFFYQLTHFNTTGDCEVFYRDIIEAQTKEEAKLEISKLQNAVIAEKVGKNNKNKIDYRVFISPLTEYWSEHWLKVRDCLSCGIKYSLLESKRFGDFANYEFCSLHCKSFYRSNENKSEDVGRYSFNNLNPTVIYKITNKINNKCYIGKTTQPFTLRWHQHFKYPGESKFHEAVKLSKLNEWTFEILEVIENVESKKVLEREQHHINQNDSINNGYNSATALKIEGID